MAPVAVNESTDPARAEGADLVDWRLLRSWGGYLVHSVLRHRLLAAGAFLAVMAVAVLAYETLPKQWEVRASILAQPNPLSLEFDKYDAPTRAAQQLIMRRDNIVAVLAATDFVPRHERSRAPAAKLKAWIFDHLRGQKSQQQLLEDAADAVEDRLWVSVSDPGNVDITFAWSDRDLAFDVVQAVIQSFLESRYSADVSRIGEAIAILEEHATRVNQEIGVKTKEVEALDRELRPKRAHQPTVVLRAPVRDEALPKLETRLAARRRALADLEELRQRRIAELQAQLQQQEAIYAEQHPALVTTRRNIEALQARSPQLDTLRSEVAEIEHEVTSRGVRAASVGRDQPPSMPGEVGQSTASDDPRLEYARHKLWLLIRQHSALLERIDTARVSMDTARAGFKYRYNVVSPPQLPKAPIKPKLAKLLAVGALGGLFLGLFAAAAADLWAGVLLERWELEERLALPILAELRENP